MRGDIYAYPEVEKWEWVSLEGKHINIDQFVQEHLHDDWYIGTDSHAYKTKGFCKFSTALIAYRRGRGGNLAFFNQKTGENGNIRPRLISEAMRSLQLAYYLDERIPKDAVITIHLDVNANIKYKSHQCKEELVGMIMAQGTRFRPMWKPNAWGASTVADKRT